MRGPGDSETVVKCYLEVPYEEKDHARALGARWDPDRRLWYSTGELIEALQRWLPKTRIYMDCEFESRNVVKQLGGRWDPDKRKWYIVDGTDLEKFQEWLQYPLVKEAPYQNTQVYS